ncbi:MAG: preprotein translocase subunit YajC [Myxococcales bacterium]|nr:preprotein translocase subunit YajC [Myxococcales bacterium]MCB9642996.1 preprotein translocase subunit YajC [Myxococcales bacterium]
MTGFSWWIVLAAQQANASPLVQFVPLILIFVLFYFMIIRPQRKREREHQAMLNSLRRGDKIITASGIHGEVSALTPDSVVVEIAPKVKVTMLRSAITHITNRTGSASVAEEVEVSEETEETSSSSPSSKSKKKKK